MAELEPLLINLDSLMCQQTLKRLLELHKHLKITTPTTEKSKLKLIGMIRAHNEEKLEGEIETEVTRRLDRNGGNARGIFTGSDRTSN